MSAKACFITAVLAVTAFTLASSCPPTSECQVPPVVYTPEDVDIFIFFESYDKVQIIEYFRYRGLTEILTLYEAYITIGDELSQNEYRYALYNFYGQNPSELATDCRGIIDFINRRQWDLDSDDTIQLEIVYNTRGDDIFYFFEKCGSFDIVIEFFRQNDMLTLLDLYEAWKNSQLDSTLEIRYKSALYEYYTINAQRIDRDCDRFDIFVESWSSSSSGSSSIIDVSVGITGSLTETVSELL